MKHERIRLGLLAVAATLLCAGCPEESSAANDAPAAPATNAAEADPDAALLEGIDLSGEEAAAKITEENADAEFEKLRAEIDAGG